MMKNKLEYCLKKCDDLDNFFIDSFVKISRELQLEDKDRGILIVNLEQLKEDVKKMMQGN